MLALRAPVIVRSLNEIDVKLTQIDHYFRTVGTLGSLISGQHAEMHELVISAHTAFLSASDDINLRCNVLLDFESRIQTYTSNCDKHERDAKFAFVMGMTSYDSKPEKIRKVVTPVHEVQSAGFREAFRYYGDIYFDGIGAERCYRKAVGIYKQGVAREDPESMFALAWCYEFVCFSRLSLCLFSTRTNH